MSRSLRARLLMNLERFFPPLTDAPAAQGEHAAYEFAKAAGSYEKFVQELGGLEGKTVLDFGCGWGGESAWLAQQAEYVVGCDINAESLEDARRFQQQQGIANMRFALSDAATLPLDDGQFDAVFSTNVFEHVMQPKVMLGEIRRVLKPGGVFATTFGPLFYSPLGYHLPWACQVPWAHVLFGLHAVIEVRNTRRSPIHPATWQDTGLNMMTFRQFHRAVREAGLEIQKLQRTPVKNQHWLAALPLLGDYFTFGIDCRLRRPASDAVTLRRAA